MSKIYQKSFSRAKTWHKVFLHVIAKAVPCVIPERTPCVIPEYTPCVIPALTTCVIPERTTCVIPEVIPSVIPEGCSRESRCYKTTKRLRWPTETFGCRGERGMDGWDYCLNYTYETPNPGSFTRTCEGRSALGNKVCASLCGGGAAGGTCQYE